MTLRVSVPLRPGRSASGVRMGQQVYRWSRLWQNSGRRLDIRSSCQRRNCRAGLCPRLISNLSTTPNSVAPTPIDRSRPQPCPVIPTRLLGPRYDWVETVELGCGTCSSRDNYGGVRSAVPQPTGREPSENRQTPGNDLEAARSDRL
jgi:hypothetical protein